MNDILMSKLRTALEAEAARQAVADPSHIDMWDELKMDDGVWRLALHGEYDIDALILAILAQTEKL